MNEIDNNQAKSFKHLTYAKLYYFYESWLKKYGNNPKYLLSCCVTNPFFKEDQMKNILGNVLEGKQYNNINF